MHTIAHEWAAPYQRKGKPLDAAASRASLCDFEGSSCALFASPPAMVAGLLAATPRLAIRTAEIPSAACQRMWSKMPSTAEADEHVLLLPFNRTLPSSPKVAPTLVILVADQALPANLWPSAVSRVSSALDGGDSVAASTSFLFPDLGEGTGRLLLLQLSPAAPPASARQRRRCPDSCTARRPYGACHGTVPRDPCGT